LFERPRSGERAILVHAAAGGAPDTTEREEFVELATSAGAEVVGELVCARKNPDPRFFIGKGKVTELAQSVKQNSADLIITSAPLSPSQERNLEKELQAREIGRASCRERV
jgi:GTP-binding protein HflX